MDHSFEEEAVSIDINHLSPNADTLVQETEPFSLNPSELTLVAGESLSCPVSPTMDLDDDASARRARSRESPDDEEQVAHESRMAIRAQQITGFKIGGVRGAPAAWGLPRGVEATDDERRAFIRLGQHARDVEINIESGRADRLKVLKKSHLPWMDHYRPGMRGCPAPNRKPHRLFVVDDFEVYDRPLDTESKEAYLIDMFFQWRFFKAKTAVVDQPDPGALADSWAAFADAYKQDQVRLKESINAEKEKFYRYWTGMKMHLHELCIESGIACAGMYGIGDMAMILIISFFCSAERTRMSNVLCFVYTFTEHIAVCKRASKDSFTRSHICADQYRGLGMGESAAEERNQ